MRKVLGLLGIITIVSDVISPGIQAEKIEGFDGNISECVIDTTCDIDFVYFIASSEDDSEEFLYRYDRFNDKFTKIIIDNEKRFFSNLIVGSHNCKIYFTSRLTTQQGLYELFVHKEESTTASKINGINHNVDIIYLDNDNNVYIGTSQYGSYMINNGETSPKKIEYLHKMAKDNLFLVDKNNTVYFVDRTLPNDEICFLTKEEILKPNPQVKKINGITSPSIKYVTFMLSDNNNNIYIGTTGGLFKVNPNDQQVTKILSLGVVHGVIDKQNNIYYSTLNSAYITTDTGTTLKIKGLENLLYDINDIQIDSDDSVYFVAIKDGIYILKYGETTPTKIKGISSDVEVKKLIIDKINNVYIITTDQYFRDGFYVLKKYNDSINKISGIFSFFKTIVVNSNYDAYIGTGKGLYLVRIGN